MTIHKKINELREETYNSINEFRNADIITDKQYEILRKRYNKVKDTNRKNVYDEIINKLNSFIAENVMGEKKRNPSRWQSAPSAGRPVSAGWSVRPG